MMVVNVTQKDKILDLLLAYLDKEGDEVAKQLEKDSKDIFTAQTYAAGRMREIGKIKQWAHTHYGYTGDMPLEEPNRIK